LNSVTLFEIRFGLALLASGRRKKLLHEQFEELLQDDLQNRLLLFDTNAAAQLAADRKAGGRPVDMRDTFIAGIALAHKAILATRNIRHFSDLSVTVVNPWNCQA
jgi:toxin FitB